MKRESLLSAALVAIAVSACGPAELVVTVEREVDDPETEGTVVRPLADVEVSLLPFDRDVVFDSLEEAYPEPEPPIPDSVLAAQEAVQDAQERWRAAETRWQAARDRLQEISQEMETLNRGEGRYVVLFREFQELEGELNALENEVDRTFEEFTELQNQSLEAAEQIRLRREQWAEDAFAEAGIVFQERLEAAGREIHVDTTDAQGMVDFRAPPGEWWVHARFELPYEELYWNVPITLERGDPIEFILNGENAESRPKL